MQADPKIVISASRRTDIPAFYLDWFMHQIGRGYFTVVNPYNQRRSRVPATPDRVHTIVFWSKDFGPFLARRIGEKLRRSGFHLFFNFTVNSELRLLEPGIRPLNERLAQLHDLCARFGADHVQWRFDPICHYRNGDGPIRTNLNDFEIIADAAASAGIGRCITSFMDFYPKIGRRLKSRPGLDLVEPTQAQQIGILEHLQGQLGPKGIQLYTCCEKALLEALGPDSGIIPGSCVPNDLFKALHGGNLICRPDRGQRTRKGCGCLDSTDIGSYRDHPCGHHCLYCYANR